MSDETPVADTVPAPPSHVDPPNDCLKYHGLDVPISSADVKERLVATLTDREVARRVEVLEKAFTKHTELKKAANSLKTEVKWEVRDGERVKVELVSDSDYKKQKADQERLASYEKLLSQTLGGEILFETFENKLKKFGGGNQGGDNKDG